MARRHLFSTLILVFLGAWAAPSHAQTDLSKFPLAKAVPADVFIVIAHRHNPERKFLEEHWARVWKALDESGIAGDVWEMISDAMSDEQAEQVDQLSKRFGDLWKAVDWDALLKNEMVHAGRYVMPVSGSPYEGVLMGRSTVEKTQANYTAIKALLAELVKVVETHGSKGEVSLTESERNGSQVAVFGPAAAPNIGFAIGAWKDVLVIGFGGLGLMDDCVKHLSGSSQTMTLASTDRFKQAFAKLPPAEDSLVFFDINNMLGQLKTMMGQMSGASRYHASPKAKPAKKQKDSEADDDDEDDAKPRAKPAKASAKAQKKHQKSEDEDGDEGPSGDDDDDNGAAVLAILPKVFDEVSIFDYVAVVEWTDGHSVHKESRCALKSDAKGKTLYDALTTGQPIANYETLIPQEAKSFSVGSGINWSRLYRGAREFYVETFPDAKKHLDEFDRIQKEQWELDIDKDVLGLLSGGHVSIEIGNDQVSMLKLTDEEKAAEQLKRLFDVIIEKTGKEGGWVISKTEIAGHKGFYQISHPMMMMMGGLAPVCGCADGYLFIATNAKAVRTCLETAKGTHPNISKNEQFRTQSVMPKSGTPAGISFEDESGMAEQLQRAIGGISMAMGIVGMFAQDMPEGAKAFITKLPPIVAKLGPVAGKLDFFVSTGSYETFENGVWHKREVQNYKGPRPAGEVDEEKAESQEKPLKKKPTAAAPKKKAKPKKDETDE